MKLSDATDLDKIKAIAELDGFIEIKDPEIYENQFVNNSDGRFSLDYNGLPKYLSSYDAILPVIQKQYDGTIGFHSSFMICLTRSVELTNNLNAWPEFAVWMKATPQQLADALLVTNGKMTI